MYDFRKEVLKRKDEFIKDLTKLIQINSEMEYYDPTKTGAPFGKGPKKALDFMLKLAKRDGFKTVNVDGYAGHIEYGFQKEWVGSIGHLDVVPAGTGWTYPPYKAEIVNNKMYGRGTEDDKGPTLAFYYAMKILKELGIDLSKRIKLIIGLDEETGWRCVRHYFKKYPEQPVSGFIPDADFPLIYAEKGIFRLNVKSSFNNNELISFTGGLRDNMVPESAKAIIKYDRKYESEFSNYLKVNKINGSILKENDTLVLQIEGKSAHGATPDEGINAISIMNDALLEMGFVNKLTKTLDSYFTNDTMGQKLDISVTSKDMGHLTTNLGVLHTNELGDFELVVNIRYPNTTSFEAVMDIINKKLDDSLEVDVNHHQKLLYYDKETPFIKTLLDVYKKHTGETNAKPVSIGGGTFARAMNNVVAFGPHFPGKPTFIHQKDEYIDLDDLLLATIIYTESLYELAK